MIAPQKAKEGDFLFQEVKDLDRISLNYDATSNTVKEFFFPRWEAVFSYQKNSKGEPKIISPENITKRKSIIFGLRSCDIRAVYFQDNFFARGPKDELYWSKRNNSIVISFACNRPYRKSCFCVFTQSGPFLEKSDGFDLQFIDLPNEYLVEIGSEKGDELVKKYFNFFDLVDEDKTRARKSNLKTNSLKYFNQKYDISNIYEKLKNENLHKLWSELGKRCINCAGCEFICPTCFCFHTQDVEYSSKTGARFRCWDSCTFSGYSRMAGWVNPHAENYDRISRRFFCKLYNCYNWFGMFACTGCGRCSFVCPVNLDMESFINSLTKGNTYQPLLREP